MGTCWTQCTEIFRREATRIQRGGGSKYFRRGTTGEHYTIEFENLVESDEGESSQSCARPISEEEIVHLKEQRYTAIADKQTLIDEKLKAEQLAQKRCEAEGSSSHRKPPSGGDFETYLQSVKAQSEVFRSNTTVCTVCPGLSSETNLVTPNTESSWDFTCRTRSTNDDATSLDLEWEDEEGMNRTGAAWERSKTEEDILRAALGPADKALGSGPTSASEDSNALEWENDFVSAHAEDSSEQFDEEFEGFVNPVLDTPSEAESNADQQDR
ncbi:AP-1 complex-associated regulatory protein isoform X10 [Tachysurus fulvidraco]|uniref:AP-1 complex-associated regulatory protein isoform X10 n=1 Tax=Tachysurus fulvidraco TaxID=1234273 RepID=UPI001FEF2DE7|nr:AP-1 complex-associated regulatory protein isoform X10 [Tachysurus fulvidraco]